MKPDRKLPFMLVVAVLAVFLASIIIFQPGAKPMANAYTESDAEQTVTTDTVETLRVYLQLNGIEVSTEQCEKALKHSDQDGMYNAIRVFVPIEQTVVKVNGNDLRYLPACSLIYTGEWHIFMYAGEIEGGCLIDGEIVSQPISIMDKDYISNGKKAIFIVDRGYLP